MKLSQISTDNLQGYKIENPDDSSSSLTLWSIERIMKKYGDVEVVIDDEEKRVCVNDDKFQQDKVEYMTRKGESLRSFGRTE